MTLTPTEAEQLAPIAEKTAKAMTEAGAHCVLVLWTREVEGRWLMEWVREGSPYEAVSLAHRYSVIDAQEAQATAIANAMPKDDNDGEAWKKE